MEQESSRKHCHCRSSCHWAMPALISLPHVTWFVWAHYIFLFHSFILRARLTCNMQLIFLYISVKHELYLRRGEPFTKQYPHQISYTYKLWFAWWCRATNPFYGCLPLLLIVIAVLLFFFFVQQNLISENISYTLALFLFIYTYCIYCLSVVFFSPFVRSLLLPFASSFHEHFYCSQLYKHFIIVSSL